MSFYLNAQGGINWTWLVPNSETGQFVRTVEIGGTNIISASQVQPANPILDITVPDFSDAYPGIVSDTTGRINTAVAPEVVLTIPGTMAEVPGRTSSGTRTVPRIPGVTTPIIIIEEVPTVPSPNNPDQDPDRRWRPGPFIPPLPDWTTEPTTPTDPGQNPNPTPVPPPNPRPRPLGPDILINPHTPPKLGEDILPNPDYRPNPDPNRPITPINPNNPNTPAPSRAPNRVFAMFPFCIPWDAVDFVRTIVAQELEPRIEFNIFEPLGRYGMNAEPWIIDFTRFNVPRLMFRYALLILGLIGLFKVTKKYIWTGGG